MAMSPLPRLPARGTDGTGAGGQEQAVDDNRQQHLHEDGIKNGNLVHLTLPTLSEPAPS